MQVIQFKFLKITHFRAIINCEINTNIFDGKLFEILQLRLWNHSQIFGCSSRGWRRADCSFYVKNEKQLLFCERKYYVNFTASLITQSDSIPAQTTGEQLANLCTAKTLFAWPFVTVISLQKITWTLLWLGLLGVRDYDGALFVHGYRLTWLKVLNIYDRFCIFRDVRYCFFDYCGEEMAVRSARWQHTLAMKLGLGVTS